MRNYESVAHYRIEVSLRRALPTMDVLVNAISDELERRGYSANGDYEVLVHGPPEMRIVAVPR